MRQDGFGDGGQVATVTVGCGVADIPQFAGQEVLGPRFAVVVFATLTVLMTAYGVQYTFGVFIPAIEDDLGWTREALSRAFAVYVFLYGALGMVTGRDG